MKTCKEKAVEWGISLRAVNDMCKKGRIPGVEKIDGTWMIPDEAVKPLDKRVSTGKYQKKEYKSEMKPVPVGISSFIRAQSEYYYVDKTMFIKEFLDTKNQISLFARPRRFGKTLTMDMLRVFFEISENDTSVYFKDKKIWKCAEKYRLEQGKYPVIFLTFKDVKFESYDETINKLADLLQEEYARHQILSESDKLMPHEKAYYAKMLNKEGNESDVMSSLEKLSKMLAKHYGTSTVIIIDEYDTPIQEGYLNQYYDKIIRFMRNFFSGAFKDNDAISYGFLTGILRISEESIFSGLNNLSVSSVLDDDYDEFFGFTEEEVKDLLQYYGGSDRFNELKEWYDGYFFGSTEIYNPWSVINYISKGFVPEAYWVNTGKNEILNDVLHEATDPVSSKMNALLQGEKVIAKIEKNVVYRLLFENPENIYSLLLASGYLKATKKELQSNGAYLCEVSIPNREISAVYQSEILSHLFYIGALKRTTADEISESLYEKDYRKFQNAISEYMMNSVSFYDTSAEGFYHGLLLGLIALMDTKYKIKSNRESGEGRFDICMVPRVEKYPGIIMEIKWKKNLSEEGLKNLSKEALIQINEKKYETELKEERFTDVLKFGIAFSGKKVHVEIG